ncbi:MAG: cell division protein SepF [Candidatus Methanomethylophilaceae archaeon]|jgi:SepF-like predicted cell division protein (DUF552 family)
MLGFGRGKQSEERYFVDLDNGSSGAFDYDVKITAVEMRGYGDVVAVSDMVRRGEMLVVDLSNFADVESKRRDAIKELRDLSAETGGSFSEMSGRTVIIVPPGVGLEKVRITRRNR